MRPGLDWLSSTHKQWYPDLTIREAFRQKKTEQQMESISNLASRGVFEEEKEEADEREQIQKSQFGPGSSHHLN